VLRLYALLLEHAMSSDGDGYKEIAVTSRYLTILLTWSYMSIRSLACYLAALFVWT